MGSVKRLPRGKENHNTEVSLKSTATTSASLITRTSLHCA
jgi:hypothetical protein